MTEPTKIASLSMRDWVPDAVEKPIADLAQGVRELTNCEVASEIERLARWNRRIHEQDCINLNPATNVMNPRAEALMAAGLGSRPSLGYPGAKYEMGLEAIERIEVIAAELAAEVFAARYAEVRVASGALANLYAFMATTKPGDAVIVPPAEIGGHVTHHRAGAAGLYGLDIHPAPVAANGYTVDVDGLRRLAERVKPKLITLGGSLNIEPHPVQEVREIANVVGAVLMFDAAHLCGMIAGRAWPNPLVQGAHLMTMSTYKSLGGPPGGLIVTNDPRLAERLDAIAFPGLTANFDAGRVAALAVTMADWRMHGEAYAAEMQVVARALAAALGREGLPVFVPDEVATRSHQFALEAAAFGGGQTAARRLRGANLLTCGIGLPRPPIEGDLNGLRLGVPEIVRIGMGQGDMAELAHLVARGLTGEPEAVARDVSAMRQRFPGVRYVAG